MRESSPIGGTDPKPRVCAVSYLNTVPLVWGFLHGPQQSSFRLEFSVPSVCADRLESGEADIGIVPCAELDRLGLDFFPDVGIACDGPVRSILLISKTPPAAIRTVAADTSSRTSVQLARIILAERYGVDAQMIPMSPDVHAMLAQADAALIIGDPALALDPLALPFPVLDLGEEWVRLTGLPMVFAVWAGREKALTDHARSLFAASCRCGIDHLDEILARPDALHGFPPETAREYLTRNIRFELHPRHLEGLAAYRTMVRNLRRRDQLTAS